MPVERGVFKRRPVTLTSLIDIIFLLLLFFMLSSTFTRFAELPLMNAGAGRSEGGPPPIFLQLSEDELRMNGQSLTLAGLPAALEAYEAEAAGETATLLITLDAEVSSQALVDLLAALRAETWLTVAVLG